MQIDLVGVLESGGPRDVQVPANPRVALSVPQGTSLSLTIRVLRPSGQVVTGGTLDFTVKKKPSDSQKALSKSATCADPTTFTIAPADTKTLDAGAYVYDCWHTDAEGARNAVVPLSPFLLEMAATPAP